MSLSSYIYLGPYAEVRPSSEAPCPGDIHEAIGQALTYDEKAKGELWWFPNMNNRGAPRKFDYLGKHGGEGFWEASHNSLQIERDWFLQAYAGELAALRTAYGEYCVRVCWGLAITVS